MFALMAIDSGIVIITDFISDDPVKRFQYLDSRGWWYLDSYGPGVTMRTPKYTQGTKDPATRYWYGGVWVDDNPYTADELLELQQANKLDIKKVNQRVDLVNTSLTAATTTLTALTTTANSLQSQVNTVKDEVASVVKIAKVVTITIPSGQTTATVALTGFTNVLAVLPVPMWVQDQMYLPGVTGSTNASVSIVGKRTKGTLILSSGPCESTSGTFQVVVLGN